jgi:hypothetical protein
MSSYQSAHTSKIRWPRPALARRQIQEVGGSKEDEQWANFGMILGIIGTILGLGLVCLAIFSVFSLALLGPNIGGVFSEINRGLITPVP